MQTAVVAGIAGVGLLAYWLYGASEKTCPECKHEFQEVLSMHNHIIARHNGVKEYIVPPLSAQGAPQHKTYKMHTFPSVERKQLFLLREKWKCLPCDSVFPNLEVMTNHVLDKHPVPCRYCPRKFMATDERRNHEEGEHLWVCTVCNRKLMKSEARIHTASHPKCPVCDQIFSTDAQASEHVRVSHYTCEYCPAAFSREGAKTVHKDTHHPFACDACKQTFARADLKRQHMLSRHPVKCSRCYVVFASQQEKAQHEATHTFDCDVCHKKFKTEGARDQHKDSVHSYQCIADGCGKWFNTATEMYEHEEKVHNVWSCSECDRWFKSQQAKTQHERDVHQAKNTAPTIKPSVKPDNTKKDNKNENNNNNIKNENNNNKNGNKNDNENENTEIKKIREQAERLLCPICLENEKNSLLNPCGHTLCSKCTESMMNLGSGKCPICRAKIQRSQPLYL